MPLDAPAFHKLPVSDAPGRVPRIGNYAVLDAQPLHGRPEPLARHLQQHRPRFGRRRAHRRAQQRHAHRAESAHIVRTQIGIARGHIDGVVRNVQFVG